MAGAHTHHHDYHLVNPSPWPVVGWVAAQLEAVRQFFSATVVFALVDLPFVLMFLTFIGIIGGKVAWVYAALLPVALLLGFATQRRLRSLLRGQVSRSNERQGLLVDSIRGAGIFRCLDGATWQQIPSTRGPEFQNVNRLALSSDSPDECVPFICSCSFADAGFPTSKNG